MEFFDSHSKLKSRYRNKKRNAAILCGCVLIVSIILLLTIPQARYGMGALCNRLFDASEAVNAYRYEHFQVPDEQPLTAAVIFLVLIGGSFAALVLITKNPALILISIFLAAGVQAYFGVSLPSWLNILFFSLSGVLLMKESLSFRTILFYTAVIGLVSLVILTQYPGVDPWIETRSEHVRDRLAGVTVRSENGSAGGADGLLETRHVNSRSLVSGEGESQDQRDFQLVTHDQEQISLPEWAESVSWLLPAVLAGSLIFGTLVLLVRVILQRNKAAASRLVFTSENRAEAICAMFGHIAAWLRSFGYDCGNLPYRDWTPALSESLSDSYAGHFETCVPDFEASLYSGKQPEEEQWMRVRDLLSETEEMLYHRSDWKKRLRLKYVECLYR